MIWLAIMLFMIGQVLNMTTAYWIMWGLFIFFKLTFNMIDILKKNKNKEPSYLEKRLEIKLKK